MGLGRDGKSVLIRSDVDGASVLREVAADGTWGEPFAREDADGAIFDPADERLIGHTALVGDEARYTFFDANDQRAWTAVGKAFPGERVRLMSWSADRKRIIAAVDSPTDGPGYALVDLTTKRASWLGQQYQGLTPADVSPVRPIRFKAADGLQLSG